MIKERILIEDLTKLRITMVRPWKIYFRYEDNEYGLYLYNGDEMEHHARLVQRTRNMYGNHTEKMINNTIEMVTVESFIKDISKGRVRHHTYSNLDREYFVKRLTMIGFCSGLYNEKIGLYNEKIRNIDNQIKELMKERDEATKEFIATRNRGSKVYTSKLKDKVAERLVEKAHKTGEYCEEYKCNYGDNHPEYGGVLTDLRSLKCGTTFRCANGEWWGLVTSNSKGNKVVITDHSSVELTDGNCAAFITDCMES